MKKTYLVFLFLSYLYCADAKHPIDSSLSKYSIGILGSIDYYVYNYNSYEGYGFEGDHYYESRNLHYSQGLSFTYRLTNRLNLLTGIIYAEMGFNRMTNPFLLPPYYMGETHYKKLEYYAYYGKIPLLLQYNSNPDKGFGAIISAGFTTGIPLREKINYIYIDESDNKTIGEWQWESDDNANGNFNFSDLSTNKKWKIHESLTIGAGFAFTLEKFVFTFQSLYQFYFINVYDRRLNTKGQSYSSTIGINYVL